MTDPRELRWRPAWIAGGFVLVAIVAFFGLIPSVSLPRTGISDKVEHALAYVLLAVWFGGLMAPSKHFRLGLTLVAFSILIELLQGFMGLGRSADAEDVVANAIGVVLGLGLCALGARRWPFLAERVLGLPWPRAE